MQMFELRSFYLLLVWSLSVNSKTLIRPNPMVMCLSFPRFMRRNTGLQCSHRYFDYKKITAVYNASIQATEQCQKLFSNEAWNCSSKSLNRLARQAYPETSFLYSIYSAALAHSISSACSKGLISDCKCHKKPFNKNLNVIFDDSGCARGSLLFGIRESREILRNDLESDTRWLIDEHNKEAGRYALLSFDRKSQINCSCHGMSGGCTLKKCVRRITNFKTVSEKLINKYKTAIRVGSDNGLLPKLIPHLPGSPAPTNSDLVYNSKSPNFCDKNPFLGILGTKGRICSIKSADSNNCKKICCKRGYKTHVKKVNALCDCKFTYCCKVTCEPCQNKIVTHVCK